MNTIETQSKLGKLEVSAQKGTEVVKVSVDLDKLAELLKDPQAFRNFVEMASTAAFHRNGEGWKKAKTMTGEGWLVWSAEPTIRVTDRDKQEAASQFHKVAPLLAQVDEKGKAQYFAMVELEPFSTEAEMAVSFAKQRQAIAAKAAAESLAAKMKASEAQDALRASLLAPKGGDK